MKEASGDQPALWSWRLLKGYAGGLHSRELISGEVGCAYLTQEVIGPQIALPAIFPVVLSMYELTYIALSSLGRPGLV